jgi:hypothetical protein
MPHGEQFSEKDLSFILESVKSTDIPYGDKVIIKRYIGVSDPGDPASGVQPVLSFKKTWVRAIVQTVTQKDVMYSGGLYQLGDIFVTLKEKLNYVDTISQTGGPSQGDRLMYEGHEYRIVGKIQNLTLLDKNRVSMYVFRKIGNA